MADEVKPLAIRKGDDGAFVVTEPWPKFARIPPIDATFGRVTHCGNTIRFDVANGHAIYRPKDHDGAAWVCELVGHTFVPPVNGQAV